MPALDQCEPQVVRALEKAGWRVTNQPFAIRIDKTRASYIYADLRLTKTKTQETAIVVEVKCFADSRNWLDEFYRAVGQYVAYRIALALNGIAVPIYLAVPFPVYIEFFPKPLIESMMQDVYMNLIVINLETEEIVLWIP